MQKNVGSQKIGCQMISATDGSEFTGAVTVYVTGDAGTQAAGSVGAGACTHEGHGYHTYAPAQAETNYDLIAFTFAGTGAITATVQVFTRHDANVTHLSGTEQTARDIGASVLLSSGTGTGQVSLSSGTVTLTDASLTAAKIASDAFTAAKFAADCITAAKIADGAIDTATFASGTTIPRCTLVDTLTTYTGNTPQTGDSFARIGSAGAGLTALGDTRLANLDAAISSRMATYTQPTGFLAATFPATIASTTNITAGTITTVTNLTNAPSSGDFTATMKTSIGTAVAASAVASVTGNVGGNVTGSVGSVVGAVGSVTGNVGGNVTGSVGSVVGAVGSVTGNVGGNVTGSVGSVATGGIAAASFAAGAITAAAIANGAIDAATFAADVDAEILSYLVDDATRIDGSALNTATGTTIPATYNYADAIHGALVLYSSTGNGGTGNDATHINLVSLDLADNEVIGHILLIEDVSEGVVYTRYITGWDFDAYLATFTPALPVTPTASDNTVLLSIKRHFSLPDVAANANGGLPILSSSGTALGYSVGSVATGGIAAASFAAGAITATSIASGALTAIGVAVRDIPNGDGTAAAGSLGETVYASMISAAEASGYAQNIQTRLPATLVSGRMDASVGAMATGTLTAAALATDAVTKIQNGLATQAYLATIDGRLDAFDTVLADTGAIKLKTDNLPSDPADASDVAAAFATVNATLATLTAYVDTEVAAIKTVTDAIGATGSGLSAIPWNASWDEQVQSEVDDALKTALTEGYRGTGVPGSVRDLLYEIIAHMGNTGINGTLKSLKKLDQTTTAKTFTLDSATAPTSITETT